MITVTLEGSLADHFFDSLEVDAESVAEVVGLLNANFANFKRFIGHNLAAGVRYTVRVGHSFVTEEQVNCPINSKVRTMVITPIAAGAGGGFGKILLGAAILGIGIFSGGAGFLGMSSSSLIMTGAVMIGTSLLGMLFGREKAPDKNDSKKSLLFEQPPQTELDGGRFPIAYGHPLVGFYLLSVRQRTWLTA
jgi:predicted phage tail protein